MPKMSRLAIDAHNHFITFVGPVFSVASIP
uniref:Uncharacterized protein n=1 Tax=Rhizophora mucronata TaxID=61149 RepID=A0A2P2QAM2_RHIMU